MRIRATFPQFEKAPTLFLVAGEFEAYLYVAFRGNIEETAHITLNPREEAREKQAYMERAGGAMAIGAVSHKDRYMEDTKQKFARHFNQAVQNAVSKEKIEDVVVLAPSHCLAKLTDHLPKEITRMITERMPGEYTREKPSSIVEMYHRHLEHEKKRLTNHVHCTKEELRILHLPKIRTVNA